MTAATTEQGLLIPKALLQGAQEVEIFEEPGRIIVVLDPNEDPIRGLGKNPVTLDVGDGPVDPIHRWGTNPVVAPESDASVNHDKYLYG
jgi:hypothetical protein